jgi:hypothetical protein
MPSYTIDGVLIDHVPYTIQVQPKSAAAEAYANRGNVGNPLDEGGECCCITLKVGGCITVAVIIGYYAC